MFGSGGCSAHDHAHPKSAGVPAGCGVNTGFARDQKSVAGRQSGGSRRSGDVVLEINVLRWRFVFPHTALLRVPGGCRDRAAQPLDC